MQEIIVQRRLNIGGSARGDAREIELREIDAERFVVPQTLEIETKHAQSECDEEQNEEREQPIDAAQISTPR